MSSHVQRGAEAALPERVVDAHHHLWDLQHGCYPWLQGPPQAPDDPTGVGSYQRTYSARDFLADVAGVPLVASVHVEAAWDVDSPVDETRWLQSTADIHGFPQAIVAGVRLERPDAAAVLDAHLTAPNVRGVRQMLDWDPRPGSAQPPRLMDDPAWLLGLDLLASRGLSFDLQVVPEQLAQAADMVGRFPAITFVLNHGGYHAPRATAVEEVWRRGIRRLAACPNVVAKASGYDAVDPTWAPGGFRSFVRTLVEDFGPGRVMFASNFPVDRRAITFLELVALSAAALSDLAPAERDAYFAANALRVYRIDPDLAGRGPGSTASTADGAKPARTTVTRTTSDWRSPR